MAPWRRQPMVLVVIVHRHIVFVGVSQSNFPIE
jgi:hypothetical protein